MRILALDGGGIRGILTAVWLQELEQRVGPLREQFDLVAGTSTGSILACAIAAGLPAERVLQLYCEDGPAIFPRGASWLWDRIRRTWPSGLSAPLYDARPLESALQRIFGVQRYGELGCRVLVPTYDTLAREAVFLKSWQEEHARLPVWEVCRASSAAPAYFGAHRTRILNAVELIDGGVVANNPVACAVAEAKRLDTGAEWIVASFGTGSATRPILNAPGRGPLEWATSIVHVFMDGAVDAADYIAREILPDGRYFRFQTELEKAADSLDDASAQNLSALRHTALCYLEGDGRAKMSALVDLLGARRAA